MSLTFPAAADLPSALATGSPSPSVTALIAHVIVVLAVAGAVRWRAQTAYEGPAGDAETAAELRRLRLRGLLAGGVLTAVVTAQSGLARTAQAGVTDAVADATGPGGSRYGRGRRRRRHGLRAAARGAGTRRSTGDGPLPARSPGVSDALPRRRGLGTRTRRGRARRNFVRRRRHRGGPGRLAARPRGRRTGAGRDSADAVRRDRRPPDPLADRRRARGRDRVLPPRVRLRIVDDRTRIGGAFAAGIVPGAEYVFCAESRFAVLDEEELRAVVAHEVGHHEHEHVLLRYSLVAIAAGAALGIASVAPEVALAAIAVGTAPAAVVLAWVVRRTEEQADAYAAEAVSGAALASALETLTEHRYVAEAAGPSRLLAYHPPVGERITRLRDRPPV